VQTDTNDSEMRVLIINISGSMSLCVDTRSATEKVMGER
jgi:hypothetical protein